MTKDVPGTVRILEELLWLTAAFPSLAAGSEPSWSHIFPQGVSPLWHPSHLAPSALAHRSLFQRSPNSPVARRRLHLETGQLDAGTPCRNHRLSTLLNQAKEPLMARADGAHQPSGCSPDSTAQWLWLLSWRPACPQGWNVSKRAETVVCWGEHACVSVCSCSKSTWILASDRVVKNRQSGKGIFLFKFLYPNEISFKKLPLNYHLRTERRET